MRGILPSGKMAQVLNVRPAYRAPRRPSPSPARPPSLPPLGSSRAALAGNPNPSFSSLVERLKCEGRHSCFFADGRKQEQAKKALESALGGKKTEFEKWDKEIKKREEVGGGGASGRGGWFGGGRWFGWFGGEHFWEEAQQAILTIVGIVSLYLLIAKGNVMFAVVFNSLLYVLRGARNWFTFLSLHLSGKASSQQQLAVPEYDLMMNNSNQNQMSAKERVVRKWGMD